ncbi:MAG TPA: hypothetical protein VKC63_11010 [Solirubrobacterales bacterium]|nr:hypothetical protein [Solirubrobacterales bacterium]
MNKLGLAVGFAALFSGWLSLAVGLIVLALPARWFRSRPTGQPGETRLAAAGVIVPLPEKESTMSATLESDLRDTDLLVPNSDVLSEHAYLVAREVRPIAIAGHFPTASASALRIATLIERAAQEAAIPFVVDHGDGNGSFGFASNRWALDFYEWAATDRSIPEQQRHRIIGMLLGYSPAAISRYEESGSGRRFTRSPGPASS